MSETKQFFDKYAYDFDSLYGVPNNRLNVIINPLFRKSMRLRFEKSLSYAYPIEDKTVLDIGCGPGHYAIALAKAGAKKIIGLDFAPEMIKLAKEKAQQQGLEEKCEFLVADIFDYQPEETFNYSILMGFMDYIDDPERLINKVQTLTQDKILFSFPRDGGLLAAQRKLRYRKRCPLYMYKERQLIDLFSSFKRDFNIEKISRDFFVSMNL